MSIVLSFPSVHRRGGIERVVAECALRLAARGHDVQLLASECDLASQPATLQFDEVRLPRRPAFLKMLAFRKRATAICQARVDSDVTGFGTFGVQCPAGGVIWTPSVHREWLRISRASQSTRAWVKQRLNPFHPVALHLERQLFAERRYRRVIALTERIAEELAEHYDVPRADVDVLPNGYSAEEFNLDVRQRRGAVRQSLGVTDEQRLIVFVANELRRKGFEPLVRALDRLDDSSLRLVAVGRFNRAEAEEAIRQTRLGDRVRLLPPSNDVASLYGAADLFVMPTQYEAWGLVIVEALATGCPVMTSRLAGAACAIREGRTGLLLEDPHSVSEIAEKIRACLSSENASPEEMAASVTEYSWGNIVPKYEAILLKYPSATAL